MIKKLEEARIRDRHRTLMGLPIYAVKIFIKEVIGYTDNLVDEINKETTIVKIGNNGLPYETKEYDESLRKYIQDDVDTIKKYLRGVPGYMSFDDVLNQYAYCADIIAEIDNIKARIIHCNTLLGDYKSYYNNASRMELINYKEIIVPIIFTGRNFNIPVNYTKDIITYMDRDFDVKTFKRTVDDSLKFINHCVKSVTTIPFDNYKEFK